MAKVYSLGSNARIKVLFACLCFLLITFAILFYLKFNKLDTFVKGISELRIIRSYNNEKVQKLVYYTGPKSTPKVFLVNNAFDPQTAKEISIPGVASLVDLKEQSVHFYKMNYFVLPYSTGEGGSDYLIFDQDGKIITNALLQSIDKNQLPISRIWGSSIVTLEENGTVVLMISADNPPIKQYYAKFDITTGKLKDISPQK